MTLFTIRDFVRESNRIEGIVREPTDVEIAAHEKFSLLYGISIGNMEAFVNEIEPGGRLRDQDGLDVRVGGHIPPRGGRAIRTLLTELLEKSCHLMWPVSPYRVHLKYELLHPFTDGNGRSGRVLWLWMMGGIEKAPLGFLHHFYYQALAASDR